MRVYAELAALLEQDALSRYHDAGDFGSCAAADRRQLSARLLAGHSGPLAATDWSGCLAAKLARLQRQSLLLRGDGAFGVQRHEIGHAGSAVTRGGRVSDRQQRHHRVCYPMETLYGYSVVAELRRTADRGGARAAAPPGGSVGAR